MRGRRGRWGCPPCSRNARPVKALVERAQLRTTSPSPSEAAPNPLVEGGVGEGYPSGFLARRTRTVRRAGTAPAWSRAPGARTIGMCSLDGRSWTTMDAIPSEERQASLEGSLRGMLRRSMRAVKDDLATPLREDVERVAEEKSPRRSKDASWRVQGGRVRRSRSRARPSHGSHEFQLPSLAG